MNTNEWRLIDRFKEPSSWNALAMAAAGMGFALPSDVAQVISFVGSAICIALGFFLKENKPNA